MILPKVATPTRAQETDAYELATLRDSNLCQMCHQSGTVQRDHRQNRQSGNTVVANLQVLCLPCHAYKTNHPRWANEAGWGVPRWADPLTYPARRRINGIQVWVLYDNAGGWKVITEAQARAARKG